MDPGYRMKSGTGPAGMTYFDIGSTYRYSCTPVLAFSPGRRDSSCGNAFHLLTPFYGSIFLMESKGIANISVRVKGNNPGFTRMTLNCLYKRVGLNQPVSGQDNQIVVTSCSYNDLIGRIFVKLARQLRGFHRYLNG